MPTSVPQPLVEDIQNYAQNIVDTVREPLLILDATLRVRSANRAFYQTFQVSAAETEGRLIYELGNGQWDIPDLRTLLEDIVPKSSMFDDFELEHTFPVIGRRFMLLNARKLQAGQHGELLVLAMEDVTARKKAEEDLINAGALQNAIFNSANFSSIATDEKGVIQIFNVGAERMLGYEAAEVMNKITPADISDPEEVIARAKALSSELATTITPGFEALVFKASRGIEDIYELTYIRKDGTRFPAIVSVTALRDAQENIIGYLLIGTDNTARKQVEAERMLLDQRVRDQQFYTRSLIESNIDALITTDPRGIISDVNRQMEILTGSTRDELIGAPFKDYFTNPDRAEAGIRLVLAEGKVTDYELTARTKSGVETVVSYNASTFYDRDRKLQGVFAAARDVTARKQVEAERMLLDQRVRDLQFYTRSLIESNIDALITTDPRGIISDVNKQMEELTGCTRDELIGAPFKDYFINPELAEAGIKLVLAEGKVTNYELTARARDGLQTVVSYNASTFYDRDRKLQGVFAAARDVTERSRLEKQMQLQSTELSDLHRRKDEFLAMLSHELRSPLAPISNAVQMLGMQSGNENAVQKEARGIIERQTSQLQHLVDDLLEVSRITTGMVQLRKVLVAVGDIMTSAVETVRPLINQRKHAIRVAIPESPIWLQADAARLEQVLVNLLTNAAKYTDPNGTIWLDAEQVEGECILRVRDTGVGITPELLPCIFDLFTQAERSLDRSQGGLGIGLALVQRLTELHGGRVEVFSTLKQGSEFVVRLPAVCSDSIPQESPVVETLAPNLHPLRVLVVDDNVDTVLSFSMLLKEAGNDVSTAHDGPTAIKIALEYVPDVVLLDIGLPGLNGYEVAKQLRRQPTLKDVVLVALTGYGQESDRQASMDAGFNHHLIKPARLSQVRQILASVAERRLLNSPEGDT
jgi:PAS domain S-box-containing protein